MDPPTQAASSATSTRRPRTTSGRSKTAISARWAGLPKFMAPRLSMTTGWSATLEIPNLAQAEYELAPVPTCKKLLDAFADGLNYFLARNPKTQPRLITHFEPWHMLAFNRYALYYQFHLRQNRPSTNEITGVAESQGSNMWAIRPPRAPRPRHAVHQPAPAVFRRRPVVRRPRAQRGRLEHVGRLVLRIRLSDHRPQRAPRLEPHRERAGHLRCLRRNFRQSQRSARLSLRRRLPRRRRMDRDRQVKTADGFADRTFTFRKTHHGPVVAKRDGKPLAVKMAQVRRRRTDG